MTPNRPDGPRTRLIIVLIAIHSLTWKETRALRLNDLDLAAGRFDTRLGAVWVHAGGPSGTCVDGLVVNTGKDVPWHLPAKAPSRREADPRRMLMDSLP